MCILLKKLQLALARQSSYGGSMPDASVFEWADALINGLPEFLWHPAMLCSKLLARFSGKCVHCDLTMAHYKSARQPCLTDLYIGT